MLFFLYIDPLSMKKIIKKNKNSQSALTLVEALLVLALLAGALVAYIYQVRQTTEKQNRDAFAEQLVSVVKAVDQKVHVDGALLQKPTNYKDDVTGRAGTTYEPSFWDNADKTLLASAKTVSGKTLLYFDTNVPKVLNQMFVARKNTACGAGDGWVPVPEKESKTGLIPCNLWVSKVPFNLIPKLYIQYQVTPITPNTQSRTPSNPVENKYVNNVYVTMQFTSANDMKYRYANIADMLNRLNMINRKKWATGTMDFYLASTTTTTGDANANGLDVKISPLECYRKAASCMIVGHWKITDGEENLRLDGMNSMVNSEITFKMGTSQNSQQTMCKRFTKTSDENTDETVPGDTAIAPNSPWIFETNVPCGIGIVTKPSTSKHPTAPDNIYAVNTLSGTSNFKGLMLDRQCNNFDLNANGLIYNLAAKTPCGIIHSSNGGTDQIILYTNEIQAKEGIFGDSTSGAGDGSIHSRTVMIQEDAILHDLTVAGNFNAENSLHVIGSGNTFTFSNDNTTWKNQLASMLAFCNNITTGAKTSNAVLAGCKTLNSGNLNVSKNAKIKGLLQVDGVLYQGAQDVNNKVDITGNVVMGSNSASTESGKTGNRDYYQDSSDTGEVNTLCVGHDLLQGEDSCAPNTAANPNGGNLNINDSGDVNNPNWLTVGGSSGRDGQKFNDQMAVFTIMQNGLVRKSTATSTWAGTALEAENAIPNNNSEPANLTVNIANEEYRPIANIGTQVINGKLNDDVTDTTGQSYSFWANTLLPTGLGQKNGDSCTNFKLGTIVKDSDTGNLLSCINIGSNKVWSKKVPFANAQMEQSSNTNLGGWQFCALSTLGALKNSGTCALNYTIPDSNNPINKNWTLTNRGRCQATCVGKTGASGTPDNWTYVSLSCGYYDTPDRKPASSDNPNPSDADLKWVGGTTTAPEPNFAKPPYKDETKAYATSATYNCGAWTPAANTVNAGTVFTQTRSCSQDFTQQCYIYDKNQNSDVRIRNTGTGAFGTSSTSGNTNNFTGTTIESQSAFGTRPVIL